LCYSPANKKVRNWKNWFERIEVTLTHVVSSPLSYLKPSNIFPVLSLSLSFFFLLQWYWFCVCFWSERECVFSKGRCQGQGQGLMSVWEELGIVIGTNPSEVPWLDKF
jgi:L-asparagine transporter-like permease